MKTFERVFGMLLSLAMVAYAVSFFGEYSYDLGRWVMAGMAFMGTVGFIGCILEWYEEYCVDRALEIHYPAAPRNRRVR